MMPWLRLTLVCWALLGLLLGLTPPADWNYQSPAVPSQPCFDQGKEAASDSLTASVARSMQFDPARGASLESLVLNCTLTASNTGPPGQETDQPPARTLASHRSKSAAPSKPSATFLRKITGSTDRI